MRIPRLVGFDPDWSWPVDFRLPFHAPMPLSPQLVDEATSGSGLITGWEDALFQELEFETWRIPGTGAAGITGWYGAQGLREFLVQARRKRPFRVYLDRDVGTYHVVQLVAAEESREPLKVQMYRVRWHVRSLGAAAFEV